MMQARARERARVQSWKQACRLAVKQQTATHGYPELAARVPSRPDAEEEEGFEGAVRPGDIRSVGKSEEEAQERRNMHFRQIDKDVGRTFPAHPLFRTKSQDTDVPGVSGEVERSGGEEGLLVRPLRRVLCAYSLRNPTVGYCQSMNFIAATLLQVMDEEDAFWFLCCIVEDYLPGYYTEDMQGLRVDLLVLQSLVLETFPKVHKKLHDLELPLELAATRWFLSLFTVVFDQVMVLKILDKLFSSNSGCLFRVAIAFISKVQKKILTCSDAEEAMSILNNEAGSRNGVRGVFKFSQFKFPRLESYRIAARAKFTVENGADSSAKNEKRAGPGAQVVKQPIVTPSSSSGNAKADDIHAKAYHIPQSFLKGQNRIVLKVLRLTAVPEVGPGSRLYACVCFLETGETPREDATLLRHPSSSSVLLQTRNRGMAASGDVHEVTDSNERDVLIVLFACDEGNGAKVELVGKARIRCRLGDLSPSMSLRLMDQGGRLISAAPGAAASIDIFLCFSPLVDQDAELRPPAVVPRPSHQVPANSSSNRIPSMQRYPAAKSDDYQAQTLLCPAAVSSNVPPRQVPREDRTLQAATFMAQGTAHAGRVLPPPELVAARAPQPLPPQPFALPRPPPPALLIRVHDPRAAACPKLLASSGQPWQSSHHVGMEGAANQHQRPMATVSVAAPTVSTISQPRPLVPSPPVPYYTQQILNRTTYQPLGFAPRYNSSASAMAEPLRWREVQTMQQVSAVLLSMTSESVE